MREYIGYRDAPKEQAGIDEEWRERDKRGRTGEHTSQQAAFGAREFNERDNERDEEVRTRVGFISQSQAPLPKRNPQEARRGAQTIHSDKGEEPKEPARDSNGSAHKRPVALVQELRQEDGENGEMSEEEHPA